MGFDYSIFRKKQNGRLIGRGANSALKTAGPSKQRMGIETSAFRNDSVAQLVEIKHHSFKVGVVGSSPTGVTNWVCITIALVKRSFKSCYVGSTPTKPTNFFITIHLSDDSVAQLVEHRPFKAGVMGSSPIGVTKTNIGFVS